MPGMQLIVHRDLTVKQAQALTERIKSKMGDLIELVAKAHIGRVWVALGYESWAGYVDQEFGYAPLALPPKERKAVTALLRGQGMSQRAIGTATGVDVATVHRDLSGVANATPEDQNVQVTGLDGKNYTVTCPTPESPEVMEPPPPPRTITCPTCGGSGKVTR